MRQDAEGLKLQPKLGAIPAVSSKEKQMVIDCHHRLSPKHHLGGQNPVFPNQKATHVVRTFSMGSPSPALL